MISFEIGTYFNEWKQIFEEDENVVDELILCTFKDYSLGFKYNNKEDWSFEFDYRNKDNWTTEEKLACKFLANSDKYKYLSTDDCRVLSRVLKEFREYNRLDYRLQTISKFIEALEEISGQRKMLRWHSVD